MIKRSGRADLIGILTAGGSAEHAHFLGYGWRAPAAKLARTTIAPLNTDNEMSVSVVSRPLDAVPFLYPARFEAMASEQTDETSDRSKSLEASSQALSRWRSARQNQPLPTYQAPRPLHDIVQELLRSLTSKQLTGRPDLDAAAKQLARLQPLTKLPKKKRRSPVLEASLVVDNSRHLVPFHQDYKRVFEWLNNMPELSLEIILYQSESGQFSVNRNGKEVLTSQPSIRKACIALTDFQSSPSVWARLSQSNRYSSPPIALIPALVGAQREDGWRMIAIDQSTGGDLQGDAQLHKLAVFASPATRIEPELLRALRLRLLPDSNVKLEQRFWTSSYLQGRHSEGACFAPRTLAELRHEFATSPDITDADRAAAIETLKQQRIRLPEEFFLEEIATLGPSAQNWLNDPMDWQAATAFFAGFEGDAELANHDKAWLVDMARRIELSEEAGENSAFMRLLSTVTQSEGVKFRPNKDPQTIAEPVMEKIDLSIRANGLLLTPDASAPQGSPLVSIPSSSGEYKITSDQASPKRSRLFADDTPVSLSRPNAPFVVETDKARVAIERLTQDDLGWASAIGRDRFGLWSELQVEDVTQRLRWIPPGQFLMGSPADEPGRDDDEGPQTRITFEHGYWMFDTPVTQELWVALMGGKNPSEFQSPTRPVEQVSWNDAVTFIDTLSKEKPGLNPHLPSEAQWEYACRAGTKTATYAGPLDILGLNNAPTLDKIAWYGGNCGQDFELSSGRDISSFDEKQYDDERGGSHPVKEKYPNSFGLYDTLGNVWEWCTDAWSGSHDGADSQGVPRSPSSQGAARVVRGGGWNGPAQNLRASSRVRDDPAYRSTVWAFVVPEV